MLTPEYEAQVFPYMTGEQDSSGVLLKALVSSFIFKSGSKEGKHLEVTWAKLLVFRRAAKNSHRIPVHLFRFSLYE